ncbi:TetR/AcrR family transcriptional regulator C-terminal domain-containing protein [Glycomyces tritici]|uniref:TetR/AcrR family transcriptional regulator C-terminal domain-containing protein n=1 Tax=Glycomyces tritici TaxID=2665176 RepID=A0ABT7YWZ6_9ACTN|nr:TetR/AcrR family transcriptional regulator C-terminal domain-containing protein [Glycomyces tritici]MDN3243161.1 TetR/AcrR family transcriptional regulator C-terminal domain-containing protein [Glycomyces tritici]
MSGKHDAEEVRSVWLRPARTAKEDPPLSLARIVEAAVALLDEEGIEQLSMRRLAQRLGVAAPSLYWHVKTKDDVVDLAVDAIFGEVAPAPERAVGWRDDLTAVLVAWRTALLRHPWAAAVTARRRPSLGPNFLAQMETLQSTLVRTGFTDHALRAATWALYNHVMGSASTETALHISDEERRIGQQRLQSEADRYPTLAAQRYLYDDDWEGSFHNGLRFLLDGLALQLDTDAP